MQSISDELSRLQVIELDAGQIFSGNPSGTPIKGYATPSLYTPRLDPNYLFHESSRDIIVWLLSPEEPCTSLALPVVGKHRVSNNWLHA